MTRSIQAHKVTPYLLFLGLIILLPLIIFWPGISGPYLHDDYNHLPLIQQYGGLISMDNLRHFVFGHESGPSGRPLAMLSFAFDAQHWPVDSSVFKRTNLFIHILNGLILYFFINSLLKLSNISIAHSQTIALIATTLWLIHPMQISTVQYVIQRMTELSALFVMIGLWCYIHGRTILANRTKLGFLFMSASILLFMPLAILCKENGVLLPLFILVLEFTLLASIPKPEFWKKWATVSIYLPVIGLLVYMSYIAFSSEKSFLIRNFDLGERLLTETRVVLDYLARFFWPMQIPSVHHKDFIVSKSLFSPISTLVATSTIIALLALAFYLRRKQPVLAFAILWFFAAHLLESTVISLELYYEHRNYVAYIGPCIALAYYIMQLQKKYALGISSLILVILSIITWQNNIIWGDETKLRTAWAESQKDSREIQLSYILDSSNSADPKQALQQAQQFVAKNPDYLSAHILKTVAQCNTESLTQTDIKKFIDLAATLAHDTASNIGSSQLSNLVTQNKCSQFPVEQLLSYLDTLVNNSNKILSPYTQNYLYSIKANVLLTLPQPGLAIKALEKSYQYRPSINNLIQQSYILMQYNQVELTKNRLNRALDLDSKRSIFIPSRKDEIMNLLRQIDGELTTP